MAYQAPIRDMLFIMKSFSAFDTWTKSTLFQDMNAEMAQTILEAFAKFATQVIEPLNRTGDQHGCQWHAQTVVTAPGFKEAFAQFAQAGWLGLSHPQEYGGQQMPKVVASACSEILNACNMSFALCPLLLDGAVEAILTAGSERQKAEFIPHLLKGQWTGTMNLTEPQAGSDLSLIQTRAEVQSDGSYKLFGTKIFITWGEHDMTENIIHLVLARLPDAPPGLAGISLFIVPKYVMNAAKEKVRNDVYCLSLEHKLGIHASPTAVMQYGDHGGAIGYLLGSAEQGFQNMFVMMNASRFAVGLQGVGLAERAYQKAHEYAFERIQGHLATDSQAVSIVHHPDVKRMLARMRALTESMRALAYLAAFYHDLHQIGDAVQKADYLKKYEYLVPIIKAWSAENANEISGLSIQVFGGMGFIEETGAAQDYRDARILTIYEGTTAIQAQDLLKRKTIRDQGQVALSLIEEIQKTIAELSESATHEALVLAKHLQDAVQSYRETVHFMLEHAQKNPDAVALGSVLYLRLAAISLGGWQMACMLLSAQKLLDEDPAFYQSKIAMAYFYALHVLPETQALCTAIIHERDHQGIFELNVNQF